MEYLYWAVKCKSKGCNADILLKYGGIYDERSIAMIIDVPRMFAAPCGACGHPHEYSASDVVKIRTGEAPGHDWKDFV